MNILKGIAKGILFLIVGWPSVMIGAFELLGSNGKSCKSLWLIEKIMKW